MWFKLPIMNFRIASDEEIHTAFETGEAAVRALFHELASQIEERLSGILRGAKLLYYQLLMSTD